MKNPAISAEQILMDIVNFLCGDDFASVENKILDKCSADEDFEFYSSVRQEVFDTLLSAQNGGKGLIRFIDYKIGRLAELSNPMNSRMVEAILVFLINYRETLFDRLSNLNSPDDIITQSEEGMDQYFDEVLQRLLSESDILYLKQYISKDPKRVLKLADNVRGRRKKNYFFEICCLMNPESPELTESFGSYAMRDNQTDLWRRALRLVWNFASKRPQSAVIYGELALLLSDKKNMRSALEANQQYLSHSDNANTFSRLARELEDREEMRKATDALENHLDCCGSVCTYGSLACILNDKTKMKQAIKELSFYYQDMKGSIQGGNMVYLYEFFQVANTYMMLLNNLGEDRSTDFSIMTAKDVREIFDNLSNKAKERLSDNLRAIDHSEAVAHLRQGDYSAVIALLTNKDGSPKYPDDRHRMSTLRAAREAMRRHPKSGKRGRSSKGNGKITSKGGQKRKSARLSKRGGRRASSDISQRSHGRRSSKTSLRGDRLKPRKSD